MAGRILIADNVPTNRIILKVKLASAFYDVSQATTGTGTLTQACTERPNLILLDVDLGDMSGFEACERLKADPRTAHIPVAILTPAQNPEAKIAALKAGADEVLSKPLDELTLTARVRALMRASATSEELRRRNETAHALGFSEAHGHYEAPGKIILIGTTAEEAMGWRAGLKGMVHDEVAIERADHLLESIYHGDIADLYMISTGAGDGDGLRLISDLRAREATRDAGIVVVHGPQDRREALMALDLGANDLIVRGADPEEMALRLRSQMRRKKETDLLRLTLDEGLRLATRDKLTGLYNRHYALPHLDKIAREARESGQHFALMLIDVDRFKSVNDTWGHATGDAVLIEVARRLSDNLRSMDLVSRFGGEEFLICMPMTSLMEARAVAERMRAGICARPIALAPEDQAPISVSVSIGLAMGGDQGAATPDVDTLLAIADRALYAAKAEGRNQVTLGSYAA